MNRIRFTRSLPVVALALAACTQVAEDPGSASPALATSADERHLIALNGYPVDTQYPERTYGQLPSALRRGDLSGAIRQGLAPSGGLYLIQLNGPVRDEALAEIRATGVELVSYVPFNAYVIRADSRAAAALAAARLPSVQFMGDYEPGFRIAPELRGAPARSLLGSTVDLTVQVVAGPNAQATLDALGAMALDFRGSSEVLNFHNVRLTVPTQQVDAIASMRDVFAVEQRTERRRLDEAQGQIVAGNLSGNQASGPGYLAWLNGKGFTSSQFTSFVVGVTDDAYSLSGHPDLPSGRIAFQNNPTSQTGAQGGHGFLNAHIIGGLNTGTGAANEDSRGHNYGLGIAPYARVGVTAIFGSGSATATSWESTAYGQGARISSNSWGYTGTAARRYDTNAQEFDRIVRDAQTATAGLQQMTVVFAAGNDGSGSNTVASPATAKNIISVGAGENDRQTGSDGCGIGNTGADSANDIISFSSRGPVNSTGGDGRVKPDLMAPGTHVEAGIPQSNYDGSSVCNQYWPSGQTLYGWSSGTSHSCPAVAGGAALVYQDFLNKGLPAPSPAMVKGVLMATAQHMTGVGANDTLPSNNQGMGRMNLGRAFDGASRILVDQTQVLGATGATHSVSGTITSTSLPFRVTLAWTDAPGPTTGAPWVNNLDLEVTVNGTLYRGNVFSGASSITGGTADVKNNVESVFLPAGASGNFTVTVKATNIAGDGVPGNSDTTDQDFALVIYNGTAGSGTSPTIGVSPSSLSFSGTAGGANPASQTLSISNTGGGTLTWSASDSATWLTLGSTSGTAPSSVTVSASTSGLAAGTYNGTITITATGATNSPVSVPVTLTVTSGGGGGTAVWDSTLQAPKCATAGSSCDTGPSLVLGRANLGPEPNQPNTINDSCADGTSGTFHVDESVDQVTVTSVDGTSFAAGKQVRVDVKVWAYSSYTSDKLDLYYAANASSPSWTLIGTLSPTVAGAQTLSATYTLPSGSLQAVRAAFRYSGSASPCATGGYNDRDDLVFAVNGGGGGGTELVTNGGFEGSASPWVLSGQAVWSGSGGSPHSGSGVLHLGNVNSTTGTTYQTLSIPTSATGDLSFWLNVTSSETTTTTQYDRLYVEVRNTSGTLLTTLGTFSNLNKGTLGVYSQKSFSLAAYRGQTVRLQFRATNDSTLPTMFRVDDVSVQ